MSDKYSTGHGSTGHGNTGHDNTGDCNTGDYNTGHDNTGYRNTGDCNTGYRNTGYYNTGDCNTGDCNTGYRNTGDYNTASFHVGCFNTVDAKKAYYFNKLIDKADWDAAEKPTWICNPCPTTWVHSDNMTAEEKDAFPTHETTGGYLRVNDMKAEWAKAYASATPKDIELIKALPAFDADVFLEITGIDLRENKPAEAPCEGREIEIDGVTYVLKAKGETDE